MDPVTVGATRREADDAAAAHTLFAPWALVRPDLLATKRGDLAAVFRVGGVDYEGSGVSDRQAVVGRVASVLKLLSEDWRVYQYLVKRRLADVPLTRCGQPVVDHARQQQAASLCEAGALFQLDLYLVLQYEGLPAALSAATGWRRWWSSVDTNVEEAWADALDVVDRTTSLVVELCAQSLDMTRVAGPEIVRFLRQLVNYDPLVVEAPLLDAIEGLDVAMAGSSIACERTHLEVDRTYVQVLTMQTAPDATHAHLLEALYSVPGELIACLDWQRRSAEASLAALKSRRRLWHNKREKLRMPRQTAPRADEVLVDVAADARVKVLGDLQTDIEVGGNVLGDLGLTVVALGQTRADVNATAASIIKAFAPTGGRIHREGYYQLKAWAAIVPGNQAWNIRRLAMLETHAADMSFVFTVNQGDRTAPAFGGRDYLAMFRTRQQTPYFFNLHVGDVGHTLVLGSTGSGKSYLVAALTLLAQQYAPRTVIFDMGHSYRGLAQALHGSYVALSAKPPAFAINPFALPDTPDTRHFLRAFLSVLLTVRDGYQLTEADWRDLDRQIDYVYFLPPADRRLGSLVLAHGLQARLDPWVGDGINAGWYDHADDTFTLRDLQVFDFEAMRDYPHLFEPLLFYVLHRTMAMLSEPGAADRFTLCVLDEAWAMVRHPTLRDYVERAVRTWRKRHAALILATQSVEDLEATALLQPVLTNCPTTLILANDKMNEEQYRRLLKLSDADLAMAVSLIGTHDVLVKRDRLAKVLSLTLDPATHAVLTTRSVETPRERMADTCA